MFLGILFEVDRQPVTLEVLGVLTAHPMLAVQVWLTYPELFK